MNVSQQLCMKKDGGKYAGEAWESYGSSGKAADQTGNSFAAMMERMIPKKSAFEMKKTRKRSLLCWQMVILTMMKQMYCFKTSREIC